MEELRGVWREATRADKTAHHLNRIRDAFSEEHFAPITAVLREVEASSRLLRDFHDLWPLYPARGARLSYYLHVLLPCYCRTLRDMLVFLDNAGLSTAAQWTLMMDRLDGQAGYTLPERFVLYFDFLVQLIRNLTQSPLFGQTALDVLHIKILRLRKARNIPPPQFAVKPPNSPPQSSHADIEKRHWAERLFDEPPHSTTSLKHRRESKCFGPPMVEKQLGLQSGSRVLFKLPFDKNHLSITIYLHPDGADMTRMLCRWMDDAYDPYYSCFGVHEVCIRRKGACLQFRRWSARREVPVLWLALFFKTWEKMVLFHCAFVALKVRCPMTLAVNPDDYMIAGERKLFQGQITDDGFRHSLYVYQDDSCYGTRLHAAVWEGELKRCPVWTAFVTCQCASPTWLHRKSRHRVWIKDIRPYVFCHDYRTKHQLTKSGEFELDFVNEKAADAFMEVFRPPSKSKHHGKKKTGLIEAAFVDAS